MPARSRLVDELEAMVYGPDATAEDEVAAAHQLAPRLGVKPAEVLDAYFDEARSAWTLSTEHLALLRRLGFDLARPIYVVEDDWFEASPVGTTVELLTSDNHRFGIDVKRAALVERGVLVRPTGACQAG